MDSHRTTLSVDIGAQETAAVLDDGRRRSPVLFGAAITTPSSVAMTPVGEGHEPVAMTDPRSALAAPDADSRGVDSMASLLRHVVGAATAQAGQPGHLVLTCPPGWGPRRHALLREAAARAGLPVPSVVAEPVAAAAHSHTLQPVAEDACVLVCDLATTSADVSVVQRTPTGWQLLAAIPVPQAASTAVTSTIADRIIATRPDLATPVAHEQVRAAVAAALPQLAASGRAAVLLPDPQPPAVITAAEVGDSAEAAQKAVLAAAEEAVNAADIDADQLASIVVLGQNAALTRLADALADRYALTPQTFEHPSLARAHGALDTRPVPSATVGSTTTRVRLRVRHLAAVVLPSAAACLMAVQDIADTRRLLGGTTDGTADYYAKLAVYFNMAQYATAAMFTTWAAVAGGRFAAAAILRYDADEGHPGRNSSRAGRLLAFTAALGLATAGLFGLLANAVFGPSGLAPDFLRATLLAAAPAALAAMAVGLLVPLIPALRDKPWPEPLHHPVTPVLLAAAGIMGMQTAAVGPGFDVPLPYPVVVLIAGRGGAALLGVAVALTLTRRRGAGIGLGAVLGIGFAIVHVPGADSVLVIVYLVAAALWWLRQAAATALLALPTNMLSRLSGSATAMTATIPTTADTTTDQRDNPTGEASTGRDFEQLPDAVNRIR